MSETESRARALASAIEGKSVEPNDGAVSRAAVVLATLRAIGFELVATSDLIDALIGSGVDEPEAAALAARLQGELQRR